MEITYETTFQQFDPEDEAWLNHWAHEGAKELVVEALQVCIDLVLPAAKQVDPRLSDGERLEILQRWHGVIYSGTTFQAAMNTNLQTAFELNRLSGFVEDDSSFLTAAVSFLECAQNVYEKLTANGMPNGLRPWRRLRPLAE